MTYQSLTIELPESAYQALALLARQTRQPLELLAAQSVVGNLPPPVGNVPPEIQVELLAMQKLPVDELVRIARGQTPAEAQRRHLELLERMQDEVLFPVERKELEQLRLAADRLMVRKAYAWALLRWRGYPVPTFDDLSLE